MVKSKLKNPKYSSYAEDSDVRYDLENNHFFGEGETAYGYLVNKNLLKRNLFKERTREEKLRTDFVTPFIAGSGSGNVANFT